VGGIRGAKETAKQVSHFPFGGRARKRPRNVGGPSKTSGSASLFFGGQAGLDEGRVRRERGKNVYQIG